MCVSDDERRISSAFQPHDQLISIDIETISMFSGEDEWSLIISFGNGGRQECFVAVNSIIKREKRGETTTEEKLRRHVDSLAERAKKITTWNNKNNK